MSVARWSWLAVIAAACAHSVRAEPVSSARASSVAPRTDLASTAADTSAEAPRSSLTLNAPTLTSMRLMIDGPVPQTLATALFEVEGVDGARRSITPARDGDDTTAPVEQHRRPSFIVDFDQDPLRAQCASGPSASGADSLLQRAYDTITNKSMAVGFITASVVFARREGDCTEHSVLAAALLRCNGTPARLAYGYLVHRHGSRIAADGHMWTERFEQSWRVADATFPSRVADVAYVRIGVVRDEGMDQSAHDGLFDVRAIHVRAR